MTTIVEYTEEKAPKNRYPERIVSPPHPGPCCMTNMEQIGGREQDGRVVFRYKRCRRCGFTVRLVLKEIPDADLLADLRETLGKAFVRTF